MIDLSKVSCCLITKDPIYPQIIMLDLLTYGFGEIIILTHSDSPFRKHELFAKAKFDIIYYQDDDALCPVKQLAELYEPDIINLAMKQGHFDAHRDNRATMGLGWGTLFPKSILKSLKMYTDIYGEDAVFKRETERILTYLNYPQNRLVLPITDLPSAYESDRLWRQAEHQEYKSLAEDLCKNILMKNERNQK